MLKCKKIQSFKYKRGKLAEMISVGTICFDPRTFLACHNIRKSLFLTVWVSSEHTWVILSRPSYKIRQFEVNSPGYKKAIQANILVTRAIENIYPITNTKVNFGQQQFVILDDNFQPFDFYSMVKNASNIQFEQTFLPLHDPSLERLIQDHQADLHVTEDGRHVYLPVVKDQIDTFNPSITDPLAL